jgi:SAM-dependent methyltransferase
LNVCSDFNDRSHDEMIDVILIAFGLGLISSSPPALVTDPPAGETATAVLRREAKALEPLVTSRLANNFLRATADLPAIAARKLFLDEAKTTYLTEAAAGSLSEVEKRALKPFPVDESLYYTTKYGSPLAYVRPVDLLGEAGLEDISGRKILDFGYGTVGHIRLLARLGADVTGVDVDPLLRALYGAPEDQGIVTNAGGRDGRIRLIHGRFPADEAIKTNVERNYDLIISKNALKRGYVHPERPVDTRRLLNLGVDDVHFVKVLYEALKPGGRVLIYNISPAPSLPDQPYKNWADGRCPFAKEVWEAAGFHVIVFDRDDSEAIRKVAAALGWDQGESPIDLKTDVFAQYSLMAKPARSGG